MGFIAKRIAELEIEIATMAEVIKVRRCQDTATRYRSALEQMDFNLGIYKSLTGKEYKATIKDTVKGMDNQWVVKRGPRYEDGDRSRELYLNGVLYSRCITIKDAKQVMESLT